jgi:light-regulated signal transduction histidine kinase (bacteriophytochrome)
MQQLSEDLLTLSRVGREKVFLNLIDMNALVKEVPVWEELKAAYPEKPFALKMQDLQHSYGDQCLIRQVLANLLSTLVSKISAGRKCIVI